MLASLGARRTGLSSPKIVMGQGNPRGHAAAPTIYRMTSIMAWPMMRTVVFAESLNGECRKYKSSQVAGLNTDLMSNGCV